MKFIKIFKKCQKTIEEIDFDSLDREKQLNILKEITDSSLSDHEKEVIEYLRKNRVSFNEVIDYFAEQRLQEYLKANPEAVPPIVYSIDEYTDDELYLADLKSKYPSFTDDELISKLNIAKFDENLFTKEVDVLRESYKAEEDCARKEAEYAEQQRYEVLQQNLIHAVEAFSEISLDVSDPQSNSLVIEDSDRNQILAYLLNQDKDGKSQVVKDIENPGALIELATFRIRHKDVINYWGEPVFKQGGRLKKY